MKISNISTNPFLLRNRQLSKGRELLTQEDIRRKKSALRTFLVLMKVPEQRIGALNKSNLRWLDQNLSIQNSSHPMFETVSSMIRWLLTNKAD